MMIAMIPSVPPSDNDPTSPIKIDAGGQLNHKNPKLAPRMAAHTTVSSPAPGTKGINRYSLNCAWPVI